MSDAPRHLAAFALTPIRGEWRRAMLAELDHIEGRAARWRFALGCARVAAPARYAAVPLVGGAALTAYGLLRWPGVVGDDIAIGLAYLVVLALLLVAYAWHTPALARADAGVAALAWALSLTAIEYDHRVAAGLAGFAALAIVAWIGARSGPRAGAGAALVVGLTGFTTVLAIAYLATGRVAADPVLLAEFRSSGARDATTYAVGETMAFAVSQLVTAPLLCAVAAAIGCLVSKGV
jgi:hypothetical protein